MACAERDRGRGDVAGNCTGPSSQLRRNEVEGTYIQRVTRLIIPNRRTCMGAKRKNFAEVANEVLLWVCCGRRRPERAGNGDYHWLTTGCCIGLQ